MSSNEKEHNLTGIEITLANTSENTIPAVDNLHIIFYLSIGKYITETFQLTF